MPKASQVLWIGALSACDPAGVAFPINVREEPAAASAVAPSRSGPQRPPILATSASTAGRPTDGASSGAASNDGIAGQGAGAELPSLSGSSTSGGGSVSPNVGSGSGGGGSAGTSSASGAPSLASDGRSPGCPPGTSALTSGTYDLEVGAQSRSYDLVLPAPSSAAPVLVALHGYGMSAAEMAAMTGWSELAKSDEAIIVYPSGLGTPAGWNAGNCCGVDASRDDLAFIDRLLDELEAVACVDRARVYAAGFSNGGMLAQRLACERSERIAAVASVAGSLAIPLNDCNPSEPVAVLHVHGTVDPIVPYAGGRGSPLLGLLGPTDPTFPGVDGEIERFASLNGCTAATQAVFESRGALCERHTDCAEDAPVELCTVLGGGHAWPGGAGVSPLLGGGGAAVQTLQASDVVWEFLSEQRL